MTLSFDCNFLQTNPLMANIGETLQCSLFEPLEYLQGNCLQAARESVDYVLKTHPLYTFLPEQSYYLVPSERPVSPRAGAGASPEGDVRVGSPGVAPLAGVSGMTGVASGAGASLSSLIGVGDLVAVNKVKEGVAMAVNVARSWDSCKRVRGAMMVQQLLLTAKAIATEVIFHCFALFPPIDYISPTTSALFFISYSTVNR